MKPIQQVIQFRSYSKLLPGISVTLLVRVASKRIERTFECINGRRVYQFDLKMRCGFKVGASSCLSAPPTYDLDRRRYVGVRRD